MEKDINIEKNFTLATEKHQQNDLQEAENLYKEILKVSPNHFETNVNLGTLYFQKKKFDLAKPFLQKGIEINPNHMSVHFNLGITLKELGDFQSAVNCYKKVLEIDPNFINAHNNLGILFKELGDFKKAISCHEKVIKMKPDFAISHNNLGACLMELKNFEKAIQCYEKAIKIEPNYISALFNLANAFNILGDQKRAITYFEEVIKYDPKNEESHYLSGVALYTIKNYKDATEHFKLTNFKNSKTYLSSCLYELDEKSLFLNELENLKNQGVTNALIGSLCLRSNIKYGIQNTNSFCNDPLNYVSTINLNEQYDFKKTFINVVTDTLKNDKIVNRQQGLLTNGLQTSGNLFSLKNDHLDEIKKIIDTEIKKYQVHFKDSVEGLIKSWPTSYDINGWLISMKNGGKLSPHMHERGWLSGSIYINVPPKIKKDSGNLVLCTEDINSGNEINNNMKTIDVVTGSLCLFPASLFHYTIPFESEEERTVLAFDVEPIN
jgi:tetratricopeptide (TPR) repeat protein